MTFLDTLQRLQLWLQTSRPLYAASLAGGASNADLARCQLATGLRWPEGLRAWFRFRNGHRGVDPTRTGLVRGWHLLSLADAEDLRSSLNDHLRRGTFVLEGGWSPAWFPFLRRSNGDLMVVDLLGVHDEPGCVLEWRKDGSVHKVRANGLEDWLEGLVSSLEEGIWRASAEGEWWEVPEFENEFDRLVIGYPKWVDIAEEREPAPALAPQTSEQWVSVVRDRLVASAREALWRALPSGFSSRHIDAGTDFEEVRRLLAHAPPAVRATEMALVAARLRERGDPRFVDAECAAVETDDPFALMVVVRQIGLANPHVRARCLAHAEASRVRRPVFAAAFLLHLGSALHGFDANTARRLESCARALRPRGYAKHVVETELARRSGSTERDARLRALLEDGRFVMDLWNSPLLFEVAWDAAAGAGLARDLVATRASVGAIHIDVVAMLVRRLSALGMPEEAHQITEEHVLVGLRPASNAWTREHVARVVAERAEGLISWTECRALMADAIDAALGAGDTRWAREMLDLLEQEATDEIRVVIRRCRSKLASGCSDDDGQSSSPDDLQARARAWDEAEFNGRPTRTFLVAIAESARRNDAAFGRAQLDRVRAVAAKKGGHGRFEGALGWALAEHGLWEEALDVARTPWSRPEALLLARILRRLIVRGREADALSLGHQLRALESLEDWSALAPAVALFSAASSSALHAALDAAEDFGRGAARPLES